MTDTALALPDDRRVDRTPVGLDFGHHARLTIDEWSNLGRQLGRLGNATLWWIGDWLNAGERFYGSTYTEAMAITGLAYQSLQNAAYVARSIDISRRRESLSFGHHAEVAALDVDEQKQWLARAVEEGMTRDQLRAAIRGTREVEATRPPFRLAIDAAPERAQRWRAAADAASRPFADWAADALDEAAA